MKVLFIHDNIPDYLCAGLFHGLRTILGSNCLDLPRFDCMYKTMSVGTKNKIRGNAFSLYGLLDESSELVDDRFFIWHKNIRDFDFYIIADIWNCWHTYMRLSKLVDAKKIVIIDPSDSLRLFPFNNFKSDLKVALLNLLNGLSAKSKYFKREISSSKSDRFGFPDFISNTLSDLFSRNSLYPISFSIPEEKITRVTINDKKQLFTTVIVDEEFDNFNSSSVILSLNDSKYHFTDEAAYYKDIQQSKFGITLKRAGWDCLRHYEYAANGTVLCFKQLYKKYDACAPHDLTADNCIIYDDKNDLLNKINQIGDLQYESLLNNTYDWIQSKTTVSVAKKFLAEIAV